uniref:Reverse transcriptase Ty1/copia-type domain-containing protein n=1 Tax=Entomoneis paludosa TaxID=265537 RepID=A0A7S2YRE1_9STRA
MTGEPVESVYSSVVSLRSLRIVSFLSVLNQLELWGADIGNAYLEAKTKEKLFIIAGDKFGDRKGHILIIRRALYGLKSSRNRWHERFADCLRHEDFTPVKCDTDVWMRKSKDKKSYEYIAVYVDDLMIAMKDPTDFCKMLKDKYNFKLKGDGPISYHIGLNYSRDKDGTLVQQPEKYIEKMVDSYEQMFGTKPKKMKTPLEKGDHPEIDDSELLDEEGIKKYLTMVGQLQWLISLGRFDIFSAVVSFSRYRVAPRIGHLQRLQQIYGYSCHTSTNEEY